MSHLSTVEREGERERERDGLPGLTKSLETTPVVSCTGWISVEATDAPCANELEIKGQMIITKGVDGLIPKHWVTFRVHTVLSK